MAELHTYTGNVSGQTIFLMTDEFAVYSNFQNYIWFKIKKDLVILRLSMKKIILLNTDEEELIGQRPSKN